MNNHMTPLLFNTLFAQIGWGWIVIAVVVLLMFGGKKIPELMKGLGGGVKEFKKAIKDEDTDKKTEKE
jgi:sec-independent protein translocase protein TatA